jgi:hypothetical protein
MSRYSVPTSTALLAVLVTATATFVGHPEIDHCFGGLDDAML